MITTFLARTLADTLAVSGSAIGFVPALRVETLFRTAGLPIEADPGAVEPLEAMCRSLVEDVRLAPRGRMILARRFVDNLRTRRRLLDREAAGDLPEPVDSAPPIIVTGFPRTGTTLSHRLLSLAADARAPQWCELMEPSLGPGDPTRARGRRLRKYRNAIRLSGLLAPDLRHIHELIPDGPEECTHLHELAFDSESLALAGPVRSYRSWLDERDAGQRRNRYEWQARAMRAIARDRDPNQRRSRWVLKAPQHLCQLDELFETFPEATVVRMHRDPIAAMGSTASLVACASSILTPGLPPGHGDDLLDIFEQWQSQGDEAMPRHADRVIEMHYDDLVADPTGFVEQVHDAAGIPVSGSHIDAVRRHLAARPKHHFGRHRYRLEDHGIDPEVARERFADYTARMESLRRLTPPA